MQSVTSNAVAVANSYSTTEHFTGKYWIDGKPIYAITKLGNGTFQNTAWTPIQFFSDKVSKHIVDVYGLIFNTNIRVKGGDVNFTNIINFACSDITTITTNYQITVEYTKN